MDVLFLFVHCIGELEANLAKIHITPEVNIQQDAKYIALTLPEIQFKDVTFKYFENGPCIFNGFNLDIRGGEKVGRVGR